MTSRRAPRDPVRYQRRKVIFALATFAVVWLGIRWFAPDLRDTLQGLGVLSPGSAFREQRSGEVVQARALVVGALRDSTGSDGRNIARWRLRSLADHPFTLLAPGGAFEGAVGDTVRVRGLYEWDTKGGVVSVLEDGWIRPGGGR